MLYHYTLRTPSHLGRILNEDVILPEGETGRSVHRFPMPCVWFSRRTDFEPTSAKIGRAGDLSTCDQAASKLIAVRIAVDDDVAPISWRDYKLMLRGRATLPKRIRRVLDMMETVGRNVGASPSDWFATTERVPRSMWRCVQVFVGGEWIDIHGDANGVLFRTELTLENIDADCERLDQLLANRQAAQAA